MKLWKTNEKNKVIVNEALQKLFMCEIVNFRKCVSVCIGGSGGGTNDNNRIGKKKISETFCVRS